MSNVADEIDFTHWLRSFPAGYWGASELQAAHAAWMAARATILAENVTLSEIQRNTHANLMAALMRERRLQDQLMQARATLAGQTPQAGS